MGFIHLIKRDAEHQTVKENDFGEVVHALVECQFSRNLAYLTQAFLLDDDPIKCDFEAITELAEWLEEDEASALFISMRGFKPFDQDIIDGAQSEAHKCHGGLANRDRHYYKIIYNYSVQAHGVNVVYLWL